MVRYTARNGTTFQYEPGSKIQVIAADEEDVTAVEIDLDDLREFVEHIEDGHVDAPNDADCAAVSPD